MKWVGRGLIGALCGVALGAHAGEAMSLNQYLEQVKARNPEARVMIDNITSMELRVRESEGVLTPELYAQYGVMDDKKQTPQPIFMGNETRGTHWRAGVRKQTDFGLGADLYFDAQRSIVSNAAPQFIPEPDMMESTAVLQLTQSLWRNGFGEATRAEIESGRARIEMDLLRNRYNFKNMMLNAQNVYWSLVSYNQVVKLQQENVERAKKLFEYMRQRTRMRLFDDTDAVQAQASYESRQLELQNSLDERASLIRQFNTLRGTDSDTVQELEDLPAQAMMVEVTKDKPGRMSREDFELLRAQAKEGIANAKSARSQVMPKVDVVASFATNGRDGITSRSYELAQTTHYPTWSVGVNVSVGLDFNLISELKRAYKAADSASEGLNAQASFNETRVWQDLTQQKKEAQGRYERSMSIEKIRTNLVKRERQRLLNGRATTFETINFEQDLALAQIQRVHAQLALLQIHNAIKTFEVKR